MKTIFIFAYYSYKDPIFQSAVLPYFQNFSDKNDFRFVLLTFEQKRYETPKEEKITIKSQLKDQNIIWHHTKWHSGKFKILKKGYDFFHGFLLSIFLIIRYNAKIVYSEGFPGAIFGHYLALATFKHHVIHTFEPHADYMVEAGVWTQKSWEAKLLYALQDKVAKGASVIMTATEAMKLQLEGLVSKKTKVLRVPSCVDLDHFQFSQASRDQLRNTLSLASSDIVLVYIGKFGGMYMEDELFDFFEMCEKASDQFRYWIFTPDDREKVHAHFIKTDISSSKYLVKKLTREEIPGYLSAADFGLVPVRQFPAKRYCSPIKDGEYWACGLPIIIPEGISDDYIFANSEEIGIVYSNTSLESYQKLVIDILKWKKFKDVELVREKCRNFAEQDRSVKSYRLLYHDVFSNF